MYEIRVFVVSVSHMLGSTSVNWHFDWIFIHVVKLGFGQNPYLCSCLEEEVESS